MTRHRAQRLITGWVLIVLGVVIVLGGISVYLGTADPAFSAAGFLGLLGGVVVLLWGHGLVQRTRTSYLDDRLDALEGRVADLETGAKSPTSAPEERRGP